MSRDPGTGDDAREREMVREVTSRAIRRLDLLEWVIFAVAAGLALVAGGLTALLLTPGTGLDFRWTWGVASILFFVVPAVATWWKNREPDGPRGGPSRGSHADSGNEHTETDFGR